MRRESARVSHITSKKSDDPQMPIVPSIFLLLANEIYAFQTRYLWPWWIGSSYLDLYIANYDYVAALVREPLLIVLD